MKPNEDSSESASLLAPRSPPIDATPPSSSPGYPTSNRLLINPLPPFSRPFHSLTLKSRNFPSLPFLRIKFLFSLIIIVVILFYFPSDYHPSLSSLGWKKEISLELPQTRRIFSEKEEVLRPYEWRSSELHPSLTELVANLSSHDFRTYSWLAESRPITQGGTGVGLGASVPPRSIKVGGFGGLSAEGIGRKVPRRKEGPGEFDFERGGSYTKYAELVKEWQTGRQSESCQLSDMKWMKDYALMHYEMIRGIRPPLFLESWCSARNGTGAGTCGGLADRFLCISTSFIYALLTNRAFTVSWEHPVPFDLIFDSASVDWSTKFPIGPEELSELMEDEEDKAKFYMLYENPDYDVLSQLLSGLGTSWWDESIKYIRLTMNRGGLLKSFTWPEIAPRVRGLGLTQANAWNCVVGYLFRPKLEVLKFVSAYSALFALPSVYVVGIQLRTGDTSLYSPGESTITLDSYSNYFRCATQAATERATPNQKIIFYLISDSLALKQAALEAYPGQVVVSGLGSFPLEPGQEKSMEGMLDEVMDTVAENWIMKDVDFTVLTPNSGFGKLPTWMKGKPGNSIVTYPDVEKDCGMDYSLESFSTLSNTWAWG